MKLTIYGLTILVSVSLISYRAVAAPNAGPIQGKSYVFKFLDQRTQQEVHKIEVFGEEAEAKTKAAQSCMGALDQTGEYSVDDALNICSDPKI